MKSPCDGRSANNHHPKHTSTCPASQQFFWILFYFFGSSSSSLAPFIIIISQCAFLQTFVFLVREHRCDRYCTDYETKRGTQQNTKAAHCRRQNNLGHKQRQRQGQRPPKDLLTCPPAELLERWQAEWCPPAKGVRTPRVSTGIGFFWKSTDFFLRISSHDNQPLGRG